jgi:hypothetical protein
MPQIECPEEFASLVLPFLARVASEQRTSGTG